MIPVTILTGFLGSGKTTLLKRILQEPHGLKIAVIENEFGEENIDNEILIIDDQEQIIQMSNGCICCTIRGDLVNALNRLYERRLNKEIYFDQIVIETTGLANPGPVAQTFFMDDSVAKHYLLDAIIAVVDAKHAHNQLDEHNVALHQIAFADRIYLNKTDLIAEDEIAPLKKRLATINSRASITPTTFAKALIQDILNIRGFNLNDILEINPDFLPNATTPKAAHIQTSSSSNTPSEHQTDSVHYHHHHHNDAIKSCVFRSKRPFDSKKFEDFLSGILRIYGENLLRYKGIVYIKGVERRVIIQGIHELMGSDLGRPWQAGQKETKIVFIGIHLPEQILLGGLKKCLFNS